MNLQLTVALLQEGVTLFPYSTPMKIKKRSKSIKWHNKKDSEIVFLKKG
jgi:hypothetical protein